VSYFLYFCFPKDNTFISCMQLFILKYNLFVSNLIVCLYQQIRNNMKAIEQRLIDYYKENEALNIKIIELEKEQALSEARFTFILYAFFGVALLFFWFFLFTFI